jgi:phage shock protein C
MKRLYRSQLKVIGGVCGGLAKYLDVDPVVVRLISGLALFFTCFTAFFVYLFAWMIIPEEPIEKERPYSSDIEDSRPLE